MIATLLLVLVKGASFGFSAALMPGPFQTFLFSQTLKNGWRRTLPAALAPLLSDGPIIVLVLLVLTQVPPWFISVLRLAGGLFIIYLAWGAWQAFRQAGESFAEPDMAQQGLWQAVLMNVLSPGPYLFWGVLLGPLLIALWRDWPASGAALVLGFYVAMVGTCLLLVLLFGLARRSGPRVVRALLGAAALLLLLFGLAQLASGLAVLMGVG